MIKVVVLGTGNVATHLTGAFLKNRKVNLVQVYGRNPENLKKLLPNEKITNDISQIAEADVYIIAVSDNAINNVSDSLLFENRLVVHTSGSMDIEVLNPKNRRGVFYPLQTFSIGKSVDFSTVPVCLEAENNDDYTILEQLAKSISQNIYPINSEKRKALHIAAVFVSNFVNHLYAIGNDICSEKDIPFDILKPLITETAHKINGLSPHEAQTGPARRNDWQTINVHLEYLKKDKEKQEIYDLLTKAIMNKN